MANNILAVIPARGGSKGIPHKNVRKLNGKPLLAYTAESALGSSLITRTVLSTDDEEIAEVGRACGIEVPFMRPKHLAEDLSPTLPAIVHAVEQMEDHQGFHPDYIIILQPTSPFRTSAHIDEALGILIKSSADSVVSVCEAPHSCVPTSIMQLRDGYLSHYIEVDEKENIRQNKPVFYARNGAAIYAFTRECLMVQGSIYGREILPFFMTKEDSLDLDDMWDWRIAELIMRYNMLGNDNQ